MDSNQTFASIQSVEFPPELSPEVVAGLRGLVQSLATGARDALVTVALYGDAARGRFQGETSDVDLLLVIRDDSGLPALDALATILQGAKKTVRFETFVITQTEYVRSADAFPLRWLDLQRNHVLLHGAPLPVIQVDRELVRIRCEQSAKSHVLQLRHTYIEKRDDRRAIWAAVTGSLSRLAVTLTAVLELCGAAVPVARRDIFAAAAQTLGLDGVLLQRLEALATEHRTPADPEFRELLGAYITLLAKVSEAVDELQ